MIKVENLYKSYGQKLAVNNVSFSLKKGEVLGFIGPNGAGKSTTMRMITGFIPISKGKIMINGVDIEKDPIKAKSIIGYLPENAPSYSNMTVESFLRFIAEIRGFKGSEKNEKLERVIDICFLQSVRKQSVETLSKGYKHRLCFAQSIIHDPDVLILDEPTDGLDPNQKFEVRNLIKSMGEHKAIIISTHILEEVEAVCSRVIVIENGSIAFDGTPEELKMQSEHSGAISVKISGSSCDEVESKLQALENVTRTFLINKDDDFSYFRVYPEDQSSESNLNKNIFDLAIKESWNLSELKTESGKMDEVFRKITCHNKGNKS